MKPYKTLLCGWVVVGGLGAALPPNHARAEPPKPCSAYHVGDDHVAQVFCAGPAKIRLTIGAQTHVLGGGSCQTQGGVFSFNLGVATDAGATSTPDYVGLTVLKSMPAPVIAVRLDGKKYLMLHGKAQVSAQGGSFHADGRILGGASVNIPVKAEFTC
jgi:hypothetical protein